MALTETPAPAATVKVTGYDLKPGMVVITPSGKERQVQRVSGDMGRSDGKWSMSYTTGPSYGMHPSKVYTVKS